MNTERPAGQPLTALWALRATHGTGRRDPNRNDLVVCPVVGCGKSVCWPDHARATHLRVHLKAGWRPGAPEPGLA